MKNLPAWMTTITPVSRVIALILFISLPFLGFFLGKSLYEPQSTYNSQVFTTPIPNTVSITATISTITPSSTPLSLFQNDRMKLMIPAGWDYKEYTTDVYNGNCVNKTNCVTETVPFKTLHQGVTLSKNNYVINILTSDVGQASGVMGGRFGDIAGYMLNTGMKIDAANCIIGGPNNNTDIAVKNNLYRTDGFIDFGSSNTPAYYKEACGNPSGNKNLWYGSYFHTKTGGYFAIYSTITGNKTAQLEDEMVITMFYKTNDVNKLPTKADMDANKIIDEMTNIVDSIQWK